MGEKKNRLLTVLFILVNAGVIGWTAYSEYRGGQGAEKFRNIELQAGYLLPAFLCVAAAIIFETLKYCMVMRHLCGKAKFGVCFQTVVLGRYYDNITPSGIGGQPFQIYYLNKNGISGGESASITVAGFLSMQFGFIILAVVTAVLGRNEVQSDVVRIASYVGIICYSLFPLMILVFTFFQSFAEKLTRGVATLLAKLHLVKDKEAASAKFIAKVEEYSVSLRSFLKRGDLIALALLLGVLYQAALMCIPYFVILAFGGTISFWECFFTTVTVYAAITFIPTPGNAGAAEGVFYAVFSVLTKGYIFWAMLIWRFFVYYIFIVYGVGYYLTDLVRNKRRTQARDD